MQLLIDRQGNGLCLYSEDIDLASLGHLSICRASYVEPDATGQWWTDLLPVGGPKLGPYQKRTQALEAEIIWLQQWLEGRNRPVGVLK
jgi:hypothetical protein